MTYVFTGLLLLSLITPIMAQNMDATTTQEESLYEREGINTEALNIDDSIEQPADRQEEVQEENDHEFYPYESFESEEDDWTQDY